MARLTVLNRLVCAALFLISGAFICTSASAQFETASVLGFVHDTSGAAVANAKVTLINIATGVETTVTADPQGQFEFTSVRIGQYQSEGFSTGIQRDHDGALYR